MNLERDGGSNDITLHIADDELSPMILEKAEKIALRTPDIWNLLVTISPAEYGTQPDLFTGWTQAGSLSIDCKTLLKFRKSIRKSGDGQAAGRAALNGGRPL